MCVLPKIHKCLNPRGRPIVSGIGNLMDRISSYVDYHITDLVPNLKSYIKDSFKFLIFLKDLPWFKLDSDKIMCTLDTESLYTSIDHKKVLEALEKFLNKRTNKIPSTVFLIELAYFVLKRNFFSSLMRFLIFKYQAQQWEQKWHLVLHALFGFTRRKYFIWKNNKKRWHN